MAVESSAPSARPATLLGNWTASVRVPGILFVTAALLLGLSGAVALPQADVDTPALKADNDPAPADDPAPAAKAPADDALPLRTGDRLTPEQVAAFQARIAALQAQGLHKGHAVYVHA